jgi:hypothetical protein
MKMSSKKERIYVVEDQDNVEEIIRSGDPFTFTYKDNNYLIEGVYLLGYMIVEPSAYYADGGWPEKFDFAYPGHLEAKTPEELIALPFLEGKTIFERFDELRFFDW